ncbi:sulfotransferase family protein [Azohydromonas caseinilytica]|uniref:Sulfotransferase n=1 Tax=Azohydromonas caseinilytica TaxID=2728836 RepID=A0A848FGY9_9BURK|nr:sulfotransferase [Azohydromonas caseinilytica]NML17523.1 sulfotransferase [Azohydromonas caseinilytica]
MDDKVVFLLGSGRSGTTLLYKLLAAHPGVGYLSNYQSRVPALPSLAAMHRVPRNLLGMKRRAWFGGQGNAYFEGRRSWSQFWIPAPAEAESVFERANVPHTPADSFVLDERNVQRLRDTFGSVLQYGGGDVLVCKRTANNRRVRVLRQVFPRCKFIHLVRDGRSVADSLVRVGWWSDHQLFWAGKTPRELKAEGANDLHIAARNWVEGMRQIEQGLRHVEPDMRYTLHYEQLLAAPHAELRKLFQFMGVNTSVHPEYEDFISSLSIRPVEASWRRKWSAVDCETVTALQRDMLSRWGYA